MKDIKETIKHWEAILGRLLTAKEIELMYLTEGEYSPQVGYCPSIYGN